MPIDLSIHNEAKAGKTCLLVAEPFLPDANFGRTVILVCNHDQESGAFGLILNKLTDVPVSEVTDMEFLENKIYVGGPVEQNTLHFIHTFKELENAIPLRDGIFWGGNYEHLQQFAQKGKIKPDTCRFFVGYSGWGNQQLEKEIEEKTWIVSYADLSLIFKVNVSLLWREVLQDMGGRYKLFSTFPTNPRLN